MLLSLECSTLFYDTEYDTITVGEAPFTHDTEVLSHYR